MASVRPLCRHISSQKARGSHFSISNGTEVDWVTSEPGEFSPCFLSFPSLILHLMLFSDTSAHDAPTLPSNGVRQLWRAYTQCMVNTVMPVLTKTAARFRLFSVSTCLFFLLSLLFLCVCVSCCFSLCPPLFFFSLCLVCLLSSVCMFLSVFLLSRPVFAFQERRVRMRAPISSVALPQAAVVPPLAELTARRLSLAPFTCEKTIRVYAARKRRPHCVPKKNNNRNACNL